MIYNFCDFKFFRLINVADGKAGKTGIIGVTAGVDVTHAQKVWNCLQAIGNIAFAYSYANVLIDIQASSITISNICIMFLPLVSRVING